MTTEIEQLWVEESVRRDAEIDSGSSIMRDAEDVFRDAGTHLQDGARTPKA